MSNTLPYAVFGATGRTGAAAARCARGLRCAWCCAIPPGLGRAWRRDRSGRPDRCGRFDARLDGRARRLCRQPAAVRAGRSVRTRRPDRPDRGARRRGRPRAQAGCVVFGRRRSCQRQRLDTDEPDAGAAPVGQRHCRDLLARGLFHGELDAHDRAGCRHRRAAVVPVPAGRRIAMVAAADVGRAGAEFLVQEWTGARDHRVRPAALCAKDVLAALAAELGKPLRLDTLAQDGWAGAMAGRVFRPRRWKDSSR